MKFVKILQHWVGLQVLGLKTRIKRMRTQDVEKMMVGSIKEILKDRNYFYYSTIGPEYCHLTDQGKDAILEIMNLLGSRLAVAIEKEDIERSKKLVLDELKGK